jgi:hypothetical protein
MEPIEWKAPEYIYTEKTIDWYWIVGIVAVSIAIISIILDNVIFAILILVGSGTLSLFGSRRPETITITVGSKGVKIKSDFYIYSDIESFWIETRDKYPRVFFKLKKKVSMHIIVMLENTDPEALHALLSEHLPEQEQTEPFLEKLLIYLGF